MATLFQFEFLCRYGKNGRFFTTARIEKEATVERTFTRSWRNLRWIQPSTVLYRLIAFRNRKSRPLMIVPLREIEKRGFLTTTFMDGLSTSFRPDHVVRIHAFT